MDVFWIVVVSAALLYATWKWLSTRHFMPVLLRAVQSVEKQVDDHANKELLTVATAKIWLIEIHQYQSRLWLLGPNFHRYRLENTLVRLAEICTNVINAKVPVDTYKEVSMS
ncbi:hypothetical protein D4R49_00120 [bacterium]|nr:MAG: hypothetical protein D4R49_00120 [bacterium]